MNIILYDGDCGFCNFWVQWLLKKDTHNRFKFASLQSNYGQNFLRSKNQPLENFDTVYMISGDEYFTKLDAVAEIGRSLGGIYTSFALLKLIPKFLADKIYGKIAANRQSLATESCLLPTPEERKKFITD